MGDVGATRAPWLTIYILRPRKGAGSQAGQLMWRYSNARERAGIGAMKRIGRYFPCGATARWTAQSEAASTSIALP